MYRSKTLFSMALLITAALVFTNGHTTELKDIHIEPSSVLGGEPIEVTVSLTNTGVAHPVVRSALPNIVPITSQTIAIVNKSHATRQFSTNQVTQPQPVVIVATLGTKSVSKVVTVLPPEPGERHKIGPRQMSFLLKHAKANGFRFSATKILRDTVDCRIVGNARYGLALEVIRPKAPSIVDTVGACQFLLFGDRNLAQGFSFDNTASPLRRTNALGASWRYVQSPQSGASMTMTLTAENKDPYVKAPVALREIVITGPSGSKWEDAFR